MSLHTLARCDMTHDGEQCDKTTTLSFPEPMGQWLDELAEQGWLVEGDVKDIGRGPDNPITYTLTCYRCAQEGTTEVDDESVADHTRNGL